MSNHDIVALTGVVKDVFAHRFIFAVERQAHLADLGPKGAEAFQLAQGLEVSLRGERRPSEIKVTEIGAPGEEPVHIDHTKPHHGPGHAPSYEDADPSRVIAAAKSAGWTPEGEPQRKPKHFEVLARQGSGAWTELHVNFAGEIYKTKPAGAAKWDVTSV